jgi:hypothetical protein
MSESLSASVLVARVTFQATSHWHSVTFTSRSPALFPPSAEGFFVEGIYQSAARKNLFNVPKIASSPRNPSLLHLADTPFSNLDSALIRL